MVTHEVPTFSLSNIMFLNAFGFFVTFCRVLGTCKLYILARRLTNSLGATEPVSLLNFLKTRRFIVEYCGSGAAIIGGTGGHAPNILKN